MLTIEDDLYILGNHNALSCLAISLEGYTEFVMTIMYTTVYRDMGMPLLAGEYSVRTEAYISYICRDYNARMRGNV